MLIVKKLSKNFNLGLYNYVFLFILTYLDEYKKHHKVFSFCYLAVWKQTNYLLNSRALKPIKSQES